MALIDLGELRDPPEPADGPRVTGAGVRRGRFAAVLVLVLATVAAAAPLPLPPSGAVLPAELRTVYLVRHDLLVLADPASPSGAAAAQLTAYRLPDLRRLWRAPLPVRYRPYDLRQVGGMLVVVGDAGGDAHPETLAVDPRDGTVRWRQAGVFHTLTEAGAPILLHPDPDQEMLVLRVLDPASGAPRWSRTLSAAAVLCYEDDRSAGTRRVVVGLPSGRIEVHDADTGRVVEAVDGPPGAGAVSSVLLAEGVLVVLHDSGRLIGYDADRLAPRWVLETGGAQQTWPGRCGQAVCLMGSAGIRLLDPATGRVRWQAPRWQSAWWMGEYLLTGETDQQVERLALLDAATGRLLGELDSWRLVGLPPQTRRPLLRRFDDQGRVVLAALDLETRAPEILAVLTEVSGDCTAEGEVLVCRRFDGSIGIWSLDP